MANEAILRIKVLMDTAAAKSGLDNTSKSASKWGTGIKKAALPAAAALTVVAAAGVKAAQAAADDAQSQAILAKAMQNSAGANKDAIAATEDWISKTAAATGVADDQLRPALGALVRATGSVTESQSALTAALDISAATGKDVTSVSEAIAKGYAGNTGALARLVPGIDKTVLASKDMNKIMGELARTTGGSAAASAETAAGKMQRFQLAMDETQEAAGGALLPVMDKLSGVLLTVATWAQENSTVFVILAAAIAGIATAVLVVNAALRVYQATLIVVQAVQKATWLTNPIGLVVIAVLLVVAAIVLLWRKSSTFRAFVLGMWAAIKAVATAVANAIKAVWSVVFAVLSAYVRTWVSVFKAAFSVIRSIASAVAAALRGDWAGVGRALSDIGRTIRNVVIGAFESLKRIVGALGLTGPFDALLGVIDRVISAVKSLIGWLGKIKVPKISLPKIPGVGRSIAAPAVAAAPTARGLAATPTALAATRGALMTGGLVININGAVDPESTARQIRRILSSSDVRHGAPRQTTLRTA